MNPALPPSPTPLNSDKTGALLKRLLREYVRPHAGKIAFAVVCMVIAAAMTAANAWMMQPVLDDVFLEQNQRMLVLVPLAVVIIAIVNGVATYGQNVLMRYVGQRIISTMQAKLFAHLMHSDIGLFHEQTSGRLISRFTNDIMLMRNAVSNVLTGLAKELLSMVFLIGVMIYQSWQLSLIALLVFPTAVYPIMRLGKRMRKISDSTQVQLGQFTAQLDETFAGVRMVKAYNREDYEIARSTNIIERLFVLYYKAARVQAAASPIMEMLAGLAIGGVVYYGGVQVLEGTTSPGSFFSFITALILAYKPTKSLANLNTALQEGLAAANRYFAAMDTAPHITDAPDAKPLELRKGAIQFEDVSFHYDGSNAGVKHISLEVPAGKTIALVGPSGSGKSTLINLILRFYDPQSGRITVDGQDIRQTTLHSLRSHIALVSQETVLFDDTVFANIAYGRDGATREEVIAAAKSAAADEFITAMTHGYDTMIGAHGVKLSGGQRQRIAIARAMLKNAPILLLDEATSSLDTTSERQVQEALTQLMQDRTTLVIAHRLSTIQQADRIYVLKDGQLVESGSHAELLAEGEQSGGVYATLYHDQFEAAG